VVGLGATGGDDFVVELAGQWQVREPVAVDVTHLLAAIPILGAPEAMRHGLHSRPREDRFSD
jgi:hypothetical protein